MFDSGILPPWALLLEIANYDPLRAQEIEESISRVWWNRTVFVHNLRAERAKKDMKP